MCKQFPDNPGRLRHDLHRHRRRLGLRDEAQRRRVRPRLLDLHGRRCQRDRPGHRRQRLSCELLRPADSRGLSDHPRRQQLRRRRSADAFRTSASRTTSPGSWDSYMTLLSPDGSALVYSTYMGGAFVSAITLDAAGNAYVTGSAPSSFPTTSGAFQSTGPGPFVAKFVGDVPPTPATARFEESAATAIGFWTSYGAETGTFSGGSIVASNVIASSAMFSFTGTAVSWIGVKCNVCGIAAVSLGGGVPTTVNTAGPGAPGSLTSEPVFSASGLAAANHTILITVTGMSSSGGAYVAVDAFDVTAGSGASPLLPPVVLPPPPVVAPPLPPIVGL